MNSQISVTELNNRIKDIIDNDPILMQVSVVGELSNYKVYPSGHHYFTLKDNESSIRCVMFRSSASKLKFKPESGMGVIAVGRISVYPRDGAYQLYCTGIMPQGMGDLHVAFEQLKEKLAKEGLFSPEFKKEIPQFPKRIVVITSGAGAAVHDIIRVLAKRWPMAEVCVMPVRVQGVEAPPEIVGAIRYANKYAIGDLIITGRGGGSIEDLWAFNDERVARAIFESNIPIISAVGHEPDVTIADFVADIRAATPSNAAELAVPFHGEMRDLLSSYDFRLHSAVVKKIHHLNEKLLDLSSRRVMQNPANYLDLKRLELDRRQEKLIAISEKLISQKREQFVKLAVGLDAMSPLKVFSRGFCIVKNEKDTIIKSATELEKGDKLNIRLKDGNVNCTVDGKEINSL